MLKIMDCEPNADGITARLEGRICGPWVEVVRAYCEQAERSGNPITLDLKNVSFLDNDAVILLQQLTTRGIRLTDMSPFLAELLKPNASGK